MRRERLTIGAALAALALGCAVAQAAPERQKPLPSNSSGKTIKTALYIVHDGNLVDPKTLEGWHTWRALSCDRCHGAAQEGLVGPSLVEGLKTLTKQEFHTTVMEGRLEKGMPPWKSSKQMQEHWQDLYAYLKGRSNGDIAPGDLYPMAPGAK